MIDAQRFPGRAIPYLRGHIILGIGKRRPSRGKILNIQSHIPDIGARTKINIISNGLIFPCRRKRVWKTWDRKPIGTRITSGITAIQVGRVTVKRIVKSFHFGHVFIGGKRSQQCGTRGGVRSTRLLRIGKHSLSDAVYDFL